MQPTMKYYTTSYRSAEICSVPRCMRMLMTARGTLRHCHTKQSFDHVSQPAHFSTCDGTGTAPLDGLGSFHLGGERTHSSAQRGVSRVHAYGLNDQLQIPPLSFYSPYVYLYMKYPTVPALRHVIFISISVNDAVSMQNPNQPNCFRSNVMLYVCYDTRPLPA